jgi:hypothetical protein
LNVLSISINRVARKQSPTKQKKYGSDQFLNMASQSEAGRLPFVNWLHGICGYILRRAFASLFAISVKSGNYSLNM